MDKQNRSIGKLVKKFIKRIKNLISKIEDLSIRFKDFLIEKKLLSNENIIPTFICFLLTVVLIFVLIVQVDNLLSSRLQVNKEMESNDLLKGEIASNKLKIEDGNFNGKDKYVDDKLNALLSLEELSKLTMVYWNYELLINDVAVKTNDAHITVASGDVKIIIIEKEAIRILPVYVHAKGMVTAGDKNDYFYDHILFPVNINYSMEKSKKDNVYTAVYTVKGMQAGKTVVITLSEPLAKRLNLQSAEIAITAK